MDTSNPVVSSDRRTISEIRENQRLRRRQDLGYLQELARTAERLFLPVQSELLSEYEVKSVVNTYNAQCPRVSREKEDAIPPNLVVLAERMPVCGLKGLGGLPVHPPGVNDDQGSVSVRRIVGGEPGPPMGLKDVASVYGDAILERKHVYTGGTWRGFVKRLEKQMGRKTVSVYDMFERELQYRPTRSHMMGLLDKLFPRKGNDWPRLDEDLNALLDRVKITAASSAGAPYWRNKGDCIEDVLETGLPILLKALKDDNLQKLYEKNPEMFLCEVKNKMDRYEIAKLDEKTRPYCCVPAHWAILFSILAQKFQDGLETFDGNPSSVNAYGFSVAKGGLERMVEWMTSRKRPSYIVYGDDTRLVVPTDKGTYIVDPDFQQMDGSLDSEDIQLTCQWVLRTCLQMDGLEHNGLWETVAAQWHAMASDPIFVVDGTTVYKKAQPNGMMSGVPGTTLFDTVKSALAWHVYLEVCERDRLDPLHEANAVDFMKRNGLVVKPGTWDPARLPTPSPGQLMTEHKFLGVQILCERYKGKNIYVPTIPEDEALEMLVVQKDNPYEKTSSNLTRARRLYDRMRGLFLTFGFTHRKIVDCIHNVVNNLNPLAIILVTNLGSGEKPEHIMLEDFAYPDSSGFPTVEYCYSLYSQESPDPNLWIQIFPTLAPVLENLRAESRVVEQKIKIVKEGPQKIIQVTTSEASCQTDSPEFDVLDSPRKQQAVRVDKFHPRSEIIDAEGEKTKYLPNKGEALRLLLSAGPVNCRDLCRRLVCGSSELKDLSIQYGVFATGYSEDDFMSLQPIQTPCITAQTEQMEHVAAMRNKVDKGTTFRMAMQKAQKDPKIILQTAPDFIEVDDEFLRDLPDPGRKPVDINDSISMLNLWLVKIPGVSGMRFRRVYTGEEPVGMALDVNVPEHNGDPPTWYEVAYCKGINKKMCQAYIARELFRHVNRTPSREALSVADPPPPSQLNWADEVDRDLPLPSQVPPVVVERSRAEQEEQRAQFRSDVVDLSVDEIYRNEDLRVSLEIAQLYRDQGHSAQDSIYYAYKYLHNVSRFLRGDPSVCDSLSDLENGVYSETSGSSEESDTPLPAPIERHIARMKRQKTPSTSLNARAPLPPSGSSTDEHDAPIPSMTLTPTATKPSKSKKNRKLLERRKVRFAQAPQEERAKKNRKVHEKRKERSRLHAEFYRKNK